MASILHGRRGLIVGRWRLPARMDIPFALAMRPKRLSNRKPSAN
jgi:hypothetical protein